jgi:hypothetical protein
MALPPVSLDPNIMDEIDSMGGNLSRVARVLGLDYHALKARLNVPTGSAPIEVRPEPEDFRELARPAVRRFAIAAKRTGSEWPARFDSTIKAARLAYDKGTHEMAQSTRDGWVVLFLIPRLVPARPRTFFSSMDVTA